MKYLAIIFILWATTLSAQIPQYNVAMTPADYDLLYTRDIFSDSTLPASFEFQGTTWNNAKIKFKGHSTRYYPKKGYSVKFPASNLFQGLGTATFNAMYTDKSFLREKLVWDLFNDMGSVAPRANHTRLTINGVPKWLYLLLDKPDKYFLPKRGLPVAPLYETSDTYIAGDLTMQPDSLIKLYYDKSIGNVSDYSDLEQLIQALNVAPDATFADTVYHYFDVNSVLNWFAGNILTMMGDSYNKNYFLYRDTSKPAQQWSIIPWDYDLSFGRTGDDAIPYPASLLNDGFAYTFPPLSGPSNVLKDRLWSTPSLYNILRQRVDTLLQSVFAPERLRPKIDSLAALIQNDAEVDPDKWGTLDDFLEHVEALKYYIGARKNYLLKTYVNPPSGVYDDVTFPVSQLGVPYDFVAYDGRQLATLWFTSMTGLDSVRVEAFPDSTPPGMTDVAAGRFVRRWIRITPYPASATFAAKLQWMYQDVSSTDREVGTGVQNERLLRCFTYDGLEWHALASQVNAYGNFATIDSISDADCGAGKVFVLKISDTYTQTWFRQPLNNWQRWYDVKFADSRNGFVVGDHGTLLRTTDAGASWIEESIGFSLPLRSLAILSLNNMFVVGEFGTCYHSVDSGKTWSRIDLGITSDLRGVAFLEPANGWVFGKNGALFRSTDGGGNWAKQSADSTKSIVGVVGDAIRTLIIMDDGTMSRSIDRGTTWQQIGSGLPMKIHAARSLGSTVWLAGDSGFVMESTNFGLLWSIRSIATMTNLHAIHLIQPSLLYVAGDNGKVFYSDDDGANWYAQYSGDSHDLGAITFTDTAHGYAVGNGGTILMTTTQGTLTSVKSPVSQLPKEFELYQNYPNPFNPTTNFGFRIADVGFVSLGIYDVLGREVTTLVHEMLPTGYYKVTWTANDIATGVYFYRLEMTSENNPKKIFTDVKKMLFMK